MDKNKYFKKMLVLLIITIFFCTGFSQCISASIQNDLHEKSLISPSKNDEVATLTFYTFDKTGRKQNTVELSSNVALEIKNVFDKLRFKISYEPLSTETSELKNNFINLLDENGLLFESQSKDEVLSLLNPCWLKLVTKNNNIKIKNTISSTLIKPILGSYFIFNIFCSITSGGSGNMMPLFMLPRPRAVAFWHASDAATSAANLLTGIGFLAGGKQSGFLLGFMGIGLTYAVPGSILYAFIGYSIFMSGFAEYIYF